jgi:hypothetical protein
MFAILDLLIAWFLDRQTRRDEHVVLDLKSPRRPPSAR